MRRSSRGWAAAESYGGAAQSCSTTGKRSDIYSTGFREILSHPMTTADEKLIARIGLDIGSCKLDKSLISQAQAGFMSAITQPVTTPVNAAIYQASREAVHDLASEDAGRMLWYSFRAINRKEGASLQERTLTELGMEIHSLVTGDPGVTSALSLLSTLAGPLDRPIGCTMASATLDFIDSISPSCRGNILWKSLDLIAESPGATSWEKALAQFGFQITRNYLEGSSSVKARTTIIEALASPREIRNTRAIAQAAGMIASKGLPEQDLKTIFSHGFIMIKNDPAATEEEKELAEKGLHHCYRNSKDTKTICSLMEQILDGEAAVSAEEILLEKGQGTSPSSSSIEPGDGFVDIDGIRLEVNSHPSLRHLPSGQRD
jgi:hypothetical protein